MLPGLDLVIVGEGPERARLAALADRLGIRNRICFAGAVRHSELSLYYSAAEALVLASSREGWANVLLESMACGTPAIVSNVGGNAEVVHRSEAGLVLAANTPQAIAEAVQDLLAAPPPRKATRAYAEAFGWEATSAGQMMVFEAALVQSRRGRRLDPGVAKRVAATAK
jgi:glycosyltransferase involved in cell wall biosynthesis